MTMVNKVKLVDRKYPDLARCDSNSQIDKIVNK